MVKNNKSKESKDKTLPIVTHVFGIFSYFLGALLIFLLTKDRLAKKHARNALNWQISLAIYSGIIFLSSLIAVILKNTFSNVFIIFPFSFALSALTIVNIVFCIIAAVKANEGIVWQYPITLDILAKIDEKKIEEGKKEFKKAYKEVKKDLKKEFKK